MKRSENSVDRAAEADVSSPGMSEADDLLTFLDNPFHGAALVAFVEQAQQQRSWPCPEATRRRAYQLYEAELAAKPGNHRG